MNVAEFVQEVTVNDPDTGNPVIMEVYKHPGGGMFAIDSSFLIENEEDDVYPIIPDPFDLNGKSVDFEKRIMLGG